MFALRTHPQGPRDNRRALISRVGLACLLLGAGVLHLTVPAPYRRIVPRVLGHADKIVLFSGLAELVCAAAILPPRTRRAGGWAAAALFVVVFPANVQMALDAAASASGHARLAWLRLPLQIPLALWARSVALQTHCRARPADYKSF